MRRLTTIDIDKEYLKFSAAHFTIFGAGDRERLHGHNYAVSAQFVAPVGDNGMCFSYRIIKDRMAAVCEELDEYTLLPAHSPYMSIEEDGDYVICHFGDERMPFLKSDVKILPIRNATVEEFSYYVLQQLVNDPQLNGENEVESITLRVSSGPGQSGSCAWRKGEQEAS